MRYVKNRSILTALAAVLILSSMPIAAFGDVNVPTSTETKVGIRLHQTQLTVDAPADIIFEPEAGMDYVVDKPDTWGDLKAQVPFTNKSESAVYLAGAKVLQDGDVNVGNVFNGPTTTSNGVVGSDANPFLALRAADSGPAAVCSTVDPKADSTDMDFSSTWISTFTIDERKSADTGTEASFALSLDKTAAAVKPDTSIKGGIDKYESPVNFLSMSWVFSMVPNFYLQIGSKPVSADSSASSTYGDYQTRAAALNEYQGKIFKLRDVKAHSKQLAADNVSKTSDLYKLYEALVTSLAPEGDYECRVKYTKDGTSQHWPLRIIGLNQDVAANSDEGYEAGSLVGLTFQFRDLIAQSCMNVEGQASATDGGGWGGDAAKHLRAELNNGNFYQNLAINESLVSVQKYSSNSWYSASAVVSPVSNKMFFLSHLELTGQPFSARPWSEEEGCGRSHNEQYLFYQGKPIVENGDNLKWLAKRTERDWSGSKVEVLSGDASQQQGGIDWWLRSIYMASFNTLSPSGNPAWTASPIDESIGVCPAFCL